MKQGENEMMPFYNVEMKTIKNIFYFFIMIMHEKLLSIESLQFKIPEQANRLTKRVILRTILVKQ